MRRSPVTALDLLVVAESLDAGRELGIIKFDAIHTLRAGHMYKDNKSCKIRYPDIL